MRQVGLQPQPWVGSGAAPLPYLLVAAENQALQGGDESPFARTEVMRSIIEDTLVKA
jgi:hypothetical protein